MIGIAINTLLKASSTLSGLVGLNIFPFAIEEDSVLPAIVYRVGTTIPEYTKDGLCGETHTVEVLSFSMTYINCLTITDAVRNAMELKTGLVSNISIKSIRIDRIDSDFDFDTNVFNSKITFTIKTN